MLKALVKRLVALFEWTDTSPLHAVLHVENAVRNLRADLAVEKAQVLELEAKVAALEEKVKVWLASPEAAKRLAGYQELGQKCAELEKELDAARAEAAGLRVVLVEVRSWRRAGVGLEPHPTTDAETLGQRIDAAVGTEPEMWRSEWIKRVVDACAQLRLTKHSWEQIKEKLSS